MLEDVSPVLHKKLEAPLAVSVADSPAQISDEDALTLTTGTILTVTVAEAFAEHPLALVPVTLYVVVADGLTEILEVIAPVFHKKLVAPLAVIVAELPAQIADGEALTLTEGEALTVTVVLAVLVHPFTSVPVTEYDAVALGLTEILAVVAPVFHKKLLAPLAVKVVEAPAQIEVEDGVQSTVGFA